MEAGVRAAAQADGAAGELLPHGDGEGARRAEMVRGGWWVVEWRGEREASLHRRAEARRRPASGEGFGRGRNCRREGGRRWEGGIMERVERDGEEAGRSNLGLSVVGRSITWFRSLGGPDSLFGRFDGPNSIVCVSN